MKLRLFNVVIFLSIVQSISFSQQNVNGWFWLNGQPTGNRLNWVQIVDAANIYAVGEKGTFMKSSDGGDSWLINNSVGSPGSALTADEGANRTLTTGWFFDANTGIVAGQSLNSNIGQIARTSDGGNTWTYIQYNDTGGTVNKFSFINANTGYLTGGNRARFFKTTDGGLTWTDYSFSPVVPANTYSSVSATDTSHIFIGTFPRKIYTHLPGQDSAWKTRFLPGTSPVTITDILFKDANTGYACGNPNYFAYTTNGGVNWTQSNVLTATSGQNDLTYDSFTGTLYMAGNYNYVYKSTNNGVNWDSLYFHDASNVNQPPAYIINGVGAIGSDLAVVGYYGTVNLSNDGGISWRNKNYSVSPDNPQYSSIYTDSADGRIWIGSNGGGKVLYSSNGGTNWIQQTTNHAETIFGIDFVNQTTGYLCGGNGFTGIGEFSKTTNGGTNWTQITLPGIAGTLQMDGVDFVDANTGWVVGGVADIFSGFPMILKTTNGGASFNEQPVDTDPTAIAINVQMIDVNTGYVLTGDGLYRTTNSGSNWNKIVSSYLSSPFWINMDVLTKDIIFLNGMGISGAKLVVRTTDGGVTWTDLTSNILSSMYIFKCSWLNLKHGVACGTSGNMFKTTNGGLNWTHTNTGFSTTVDVRLPAKNIWFTVSDRNGFYQAGKKTENISSVSVNVTTAMQGFWNGKPLISDTVKVELHSSVSPFALIDQAGEVVNINGYATYEFYNAPAGNYYIAVKHRNSIQTWSASPVAMLAGGNYNYDFTTSSSKAMGDNLVFKTGIYCLYSGDVDQDEIIDAFDLSDVENNVDNAGYLRQDVTGDNYVDAGDVALVENNQGISTVRP